MNANSVAPSARQGPPTLRALTSRWQQSSDLSIGTLSPPPSLTAAEALAYFMIAALLDTVIGLRSFPEVLHGDLLNPDSYMRLDRLHDILVRHAPLHVVLRDASGAERCTALVSPSGQPVAPPRRYNRSWVSPLHCTSQQCY